MRGRGGEMCRRHGRRLWRARDRNASRRLREGDGSQQGVDDAEALPRIQERVPVHIKACVQLVQLLLTGCAKALLLEDRRQKTSDLTVVPRQVPVPVTVTPHVGLHRPPQQLAALETGNDARTVRRVRRGGDAHAEGELGEIDRNATRIHDGGRPHHRWCCCAGNPVLGQCQSLASPRCSKRNHWHRGRLAGRRCIALWCP
mmetsp:Transcript_108006/g.344827  ORF Transcript_108006/g.344827 Transcript_108006/m.344827 type:complete len:201 (+) Transcript_108006:1967-2569(+)